MSLEGPELKRSKARRKPQLVFGRNLEWEECQGCSLPSGFLFVAKGLRLCTQCHFMDAVQRDKKDLHAAIEELRKRCLCAYCGEYASDVEHVIARRTHLPTFTVPACNECNLIAGGKLFSSFEDKIQYIKAKLQEKYRKVIASPEWDESELEEMGYAMREKIKATELARKVMLQRLDWAPLFIGLYDQGS